MLGRACSSHSETLAVHEISVWEGAMWGLSGHPPAGTLEVTHTGLCGEGVRVHVIPAS